MGGMTLCNRVDKAQPCPSSSDSGKDCYDLTFVGLVRYQLQFQGKRRNAFKIRSRDIRVVVRNPKTSSAAIERVDMVGGIVEAGKFIVEEKEFSDPIRGNSHGHSQFLEPAMTDDGRLLVFRSGFRKFLHGSTSPNNVDVAYMVSPETAPKCSAKGFLSIQTIAFAPHDPAMKKSNGQARYGIAAQPWRDGVGKPMATHATVGTYPGSTARVTTCFLKPWDPHSTTGLLKKYPEEARPLRKRRRAAAINCSASSTIMILVAVM